MKIAYEVSVDDVVDFQEYRLSPFTKAFYRWILPSLFAGYFVLSSFWGSDEEVSMTDRLIANGVVALISFFGWKWFIAWRERRIRKKVASKGAGAVGRHEMELADGSLVERTDVNTSTYTMDAVQRIVRRGEHTLIYVGPANAHVIPHQGVVVGDVNDFTDAVETAAGLAVSA